MENIPDNFEELAEQEAWGQAIQNEVLMRHLNDGVPVEACLDEGKEPLKKAA